MLEHYAVDSMVFPIPGRLGRAGYLPPTHGPLWDLSLYRSWDEACNFSSSWTLFLVLCFALQYSNKKDPHCRDTWKVKVSLP